MEATEPKKIRNSISTVNSWLVSRDQLDNIRAAMELARSPERLAMSFEDNDRALRYAGVEVSDGIGIINITGTLARYDDFWSWIFGGTSIEMLDYALSAALASPQIQGIMLRVDSPGGDANGVSEMSGKIRAASKQKPIFAYVDGGACSGAYWLASAATKIIVNDIARVGSVGAYYLFYDETKALEMQGLKEIKIVSSQSPKKVPDPATKEGADLYQVQVDALAQVFIEAVAANRGTTVENVLSNFGQGDVFLGAEAVTRGMADKVGTLETALAELGRKISSTGGMRVMAGDTAPQVEEKLDRNALMAEGAAAERERIKGIDTLNVSDEYKDIVVAAKWDGKSSAADVALRVMTAQNEKQANLKVARGNDAAEVNAALPAGDEVPAHAEENPLISAGKKRGVIKEGR